MDTTLLIGVLGAGMLLVAFTASAFKYLDEDSRIYHLLNLLGGGLLTWYGYMLSSWPFVVLEGIWTLVAAWHLVRLARKPKSS